MSKYLLVPVMPTPNGPLHLGHIAGPFLKMDAVARFLRRESHTVALVSATDPYETHVLPKAAHLGIRAEDVCELYHRDIERGYRALDIEYDCFANPMDSQHHKRLSGMTTVLLEAFHARHLIVVKDELIPYSTKFKRAIVGSALEGTCPICGVADAGGFHCEDCGAEISPQDLRHAQPTQVEESWEWRRCSSAFLKLDEPDKLIALLHSLPLEPRLIELAQGHIRRSGALIRISHPGHYGIPCRLPGVSPDSVVFTYSALYILSMLCGELGAPLLGEQMNPFSSTSDVITVTSFGFDNTVPYLVSVAGQMLSATNTRTYSFFLPNYFCTLDGAKFSTSRGHAIWAHEALHFLGTSADLLRLYLLVYTHANAPFDFSTKHFEAFRDRLGPRLRDIQNRASICTSGPLTHADRSRFRHLLAEQRRCFSLSALDLSSAAEGVLSWLEPSDATPLNRSWLRALAVLAWPFMPGLSKIFWNLTGALGLPQVAAVE